MSLFAVNLVELRGLMGAGSLFECFLHIAGVPSDDDKDGFLFWGPSLIRPVEDVMRDAQYDWKCAHRSVIIADYLQECWWYALWLDGPWAGRVSLVLGCADEPAPVFGSLADFLRAYLDGDDRLYSARES